MIIPVTCLRKLKWWEFAIALGEAHRVLTRVFYWPLAIRKRFLQACGYCAWSIVSWALLVFSTHTAINKTGQVSYRLILAIYFGGRSGFFYLTRGNLSVMNLLPFIIILYSMPEWTCSGFEHCIPASFDRTWHICKWGDMKVWHRKKLSIWDVTLKMKALRRDAPA
jgi:hypothetical protein